MERYFYSPIRRNSNEFRTVPTKENRQMNIPAYLKRIHYTQPPRPENETLRALQIAHM